MKKTSRKINPNRFILGMVPRACAECKHIQHVFFKTQDEYDKWDCPVCNERISEDEDLQVEHSVGGEVQEPSSGSGGE